MVLLISAETAILIVDFALLAPSSSRRTSESSRSRSNPTVRATRSDDSNMAAINPPVSANDSHSPGTA
jgi:hypothetical protein